MGISVGISVGESVGVSVGVTGRICEGNFCSPFLKMSSAREVARGQLGRQAYMV